MLLNGSGEVLISAREPVLAMWLPAARVPPSSPAMTATSGLSWSAAPIGQQGAGRHAHEGVQHVVHAVD